MNTKQFNDACRYYSIFKFKLFVREIPKTCFKSSDIIHGVELLCALGKKSHLEILFQNGLKKDDLDKLGSVRCCSVGSHYEACKPSYDEYMINSSGEEIIDKTSYRKRPCECRNPEDKILKVLEYLKIQKCDINASLSDDSLLSGVTLLHHICRNDHIEGNVKILEFLFNGCVKINLKDRNGETFVMSSIIRMRKENVRFLYRKNFDIRITESITDEMLRIPSDVYIVASEEKYRVYFYRRLMDKMIDDIISEENNFFCDWDISIVD